jgi:uncharacterized repeat protein (TIGR01451 family)
MVAAVGLFAVALLAAAAPVGAGVLSGLRIDDPGAQKGALFGFAVTGLGDVNGDGTGDVAVGAPGAGKVYVFSGADLSLVRQIGDPDDLTKTQCEPSQAEPSPCNFGYAVADVGDVNGDGTDDLAVGAPGPFGAVALPCGIVDPNEPCPQLGRAFVFSGATGGLLVRLAALKVGQQGASLAPLGSVDGDSVPDVALVASGNPFGAGGLVAAFSGANGSLLWTQPVLPTNVGIPGLVSAPLADVADLTGDGKKDLLVGADCATVGAATCAGKVYLLSGASGAVVRTHDNPSPLTQDTFGVGVGTVGDQNADGVDDYAVSEPGGSGSAGSVIHLFSGATGAAIGTPIAGPADERNAPGSTHRTMSVAGIDNSSFWIGASATGAAFLLDKLGNVLLQASDSIAGTAFGISVATIGPLPGASGLDAVVGAPFRAVNGVEQAGAVFVLRPEADLRIAKTAAPATAVPGDVVTYSITVTNDGPSPAAGVTLLDPIPAGTSFVAGSLADDPACSFDALLGRVECGPGTLAAGASFGFDFDVHVADDAAVPSTVSNSASASSVSRDPDDSDNTATADAAITCDVIGTPGKDVLVGTKAGESICGLGGDDHLVGLAGDDVLVGGAGDDMLHGDTGADVLRGGPGNDSLFGGPGFDLLDGGSGFDTCKTQGGGGTSSACEP